MFHRRKSLSPYGTLGLILVAILLVYFVVLTVLESREFSPFLVYEYDTSLPVSMHTPLNNSNETIPKQTHHHSNDTLELLAKNMTLLEANQTVLENLVESINQSTVLEDVFLLNATGIVNPHPFNYIMNQQNICKNKDIFLLIYVHTAPKHFKQRMVIRQTWGNYKQYDVNVRLVFFVGMTVGRPKEQSSLYFENEQYGDIVQEDFIDTYKNLTYKAVAALKWIHLNCKHAQFVLKSDDDIFVNMFTLLRHLKSRVTTNTDKNLLLCLLWNKIKIEVARKGKWKVSEKEYKDKYYPTYCSGSAYTMSTDVAIKLHKTSYYVPFFWVDDLYITGFLPMKNGIKHAQFMSTYILDEKKFEKLFTGPQWYSYIFCHVHNLNKIRSVWKKVKELNSRKVIPSYKFAIPKEKPINNKEKEHNRKQLKKVPAKKARGH